MLDSGLHHLYFKGLSQKLDFFFLAHLYLITLNAQQTMPEGGWADKAISTKEWQCQGHSTDTDLHIPASSANGRKEVPCRLAQEHPVLQPKN